MHRCRAISESGELLQATFNPAVGMNMISYCKGDVQVIDQKTAPLFNERMAGLGALIGPHFHHRKEEDIPKLDLEPIFPFIKALKEKGQNEFFSHGIARYVPWKYEGDGNSISATLSGADTIQGIKLSTIEGQHFELKYSAKLLPDGLHIDYQVEAKKPSVIGLHYYYALPQARAKVEAQVDSKYHHPEGWKEIPNSWLKNSHQLSFDINESTEADFGFRPLGNSLESHIQLQAVDYSLSIKTESINPEHAWQLYHPKGASYVCLEPVSAINPREPTKVSSQLKVHIQILDL